MRLYILYYVLQNIFYCLIVMAQAQFVTDILVDRWTNGRQMAKVEKLYVLLNAGDIIYKLFIERRYSLKHIYINRQHTRYTELPALSWTGGQIPHLNYHSHNMWTKTPTWITITIKPLSFASSMIQLNFTKQKKKKRKDKKETVVQSIKVKINICFFPFASARLSKQVRFYVTWPNISMFLQIIMV